MLETRELGAAIFAKIDSQLLDRGIRISDGTIVHVPISDRLLARHL